MIQVELGFSKDIGNCVYGKKDGMSFCFDKRKADLTVLGDRLSVKVEEKTWTRRIKAHADLPLNEPKFFKQRKCLCCKKSFKAERWIYVCDGCKETEVWQYGDTAFSRGA